MLYGIHEEKQLHVCVTKLIVLWGHLLQQLVTSELRVP